MTSRLLKSLQITARKGRPIQEADSSQRFQGFDAESCSKSLVFRIRPRWSKHFKFIGLGCLAASLFFSQGAINEGFAQQPSSLQGAAIPRNLAPPVHIAPGSATALPPNRHRPKPTPGLELIKTPRQKESIGIQDRLAQRISNRVQSGNPTLARRIPVGSPDHAYLPETTSSQKQFESQGQVVGSGLRDTSVQGYELAQQEALNQVEAVHRSGGEQNYEQGFEQDPQYVQDYAEPAPMSVVESEKFGVELPQMPSLPGRRQTKEAVSNNRPNSNVRPATAQEGETAPVRHAFVQEQYLRNQARQEAQYDETMMQPGQSIEWSDEQAQSQNAVRKLQRVPARPTSILHRQDQEQNTSEARPQPATEQDNQRSDGFQDEIDRLDRQFEERNPGDKKAPEQLPEQVDRPRSLLDLDDDKDDDADLNGLDIDDQDSEDEDSDDEDSEDQEKKAKTSLLDRTCEEFRSSLLKTSIRDIALDISPPPINTDQNFMGISRSWTDRSGQIIATGTMVDLRRGYVFLDNGQKIAFARLSEPDIAAVSEHWNIPKSCLVASVGTVERCWQPQTYQWTASSLCHKPLYFENIQLERYGHSHGPIMQPVRSVGHFFVSLATLPYHTAIHPPNECEYALGLYRPGDCAPWLKDPIPISLDGMKRQALVTTGLAFIP